jgi:hypothetical protein
VEADPRKPPRVRGSDLVLQELNMEGGAPCTVAAAGNRPIALRILPLKAPHPVEEPDDNE